MKIINETGMAIGTKIFGKNGEDITRQLALSDVVVRISVEKEVTADITVICKQWSISPKAVKWFIFGDGVAPHEPIKSIELENGDRLSFETGEPAWAYQRPKLIDPANMIYQWDEPWEPVEKTVAGIVSEYGFVGDYSSFAELSTAPVFAGQYATCDAENLVRIGGVPQYAIAPKARL